MRLASRRHMSQRRRGHEAVSKGRESRGQAGPSTHPTNMIIPNVLSIQKYVLLHCIINIRVNSSIVFRNKNNEATPRGRLSD